MALLWPAALEWLVNADSPILAMLKVFIHTPHRALNESPWTFNSQELYTIVPSQRSLILHKDQTPVALSTKIIKSMQLTVQIFFFHRHHFAYLIYWPQATLEVLAWTFDISQGGRGSFTYLLKGQIHFALKLFVGRPIKQFWMLFSLVFLVSFDQHAFLQFHYKTIILPKLAKFQVCSFEK